MLLCEPAFASGSLMGAYASTNIVSRVFSVDVKIFKMATTFDQELRKVSTTHMYRFDKTPDKLLFEVIIKLKFKVRRVFAYSSQNLMGYRGKSCLQPASTAPDTATLLSET